MPILCERIFRQAKTAAA